jgi:inward rectifier potassium channel
MKIDDPGAGLKMRSSAPANKPKPGQIPPRNPRGRIAVVRGQDGTRYRDIYHQSLMASWPVFILGLLGIFVAINVIFAALYMTDPRGLSNAAPGDFWARFIFSVQTMGSIAYTDIVPRSHYVDVIVMVEAFAVVLKYHGVPTLMFRAANQRGNQVLDASINVTIARTSTSPEGITMRRFEELQLVRARTSLFALSWTVMHCIDEKSPLFGVTPQTMAEQDMEIVALLSGRDDVLADTIYARHTYSPDSILWDRRFVDVISTTPQGRLIVDLAFFHDTEPHLT